MSMWRKGAVDQQRELKLAALGIPSRNAQRKGLVPATTETALRLSAVWAALRVRADLLSTLPCDAYRKVEGVNIEINKPPVLVNPGGKYWPYIHWMWATQFDLDRVGNTIGLIKEWDGTGKPSVIEPQPADKCSVFQNKGMSTHKYRIGGKEYDPDVVWHERQYPVPGLPIGLSPLAMSAWTVSESLSMQQFALDWFGGGGVPKARLHNTKRSLDDPRQGVGAEARRVKDRYMATVANGDVFVHGNDWELNFMQAEKAGMEWLEGRQFGLAECARFFGVPVDLIDAAISGAGSITYQNAVQRNLQFLIMNFQPVITRREYALSELMARPRFVKLNANALLRMDPEQQVKVIDMRIKSKTLSNTEARGIYDLPPLTAEQRKEFDELYGPPKQNTPAKIQNEDEAVLLERVSPLSVVPWQVAG